MKEARDLKDGCGPLSLQWALARDGRTPSLRLLAKDCNLKRDKGATTASMISALVKRGYKPWQEQDVSWEHLEDMLTTCHIIIAWWTMFFPSGVDEGSGSHWSVVDELLPSRVALYDPTFDCVVQYPRMTLDALWLSPETIDGVLHDECRLAIFAPRRIYRARKTTAALPKGGPSSKRTRSGV